MNILEFLTKCKTLVARTINRNETNKLLMGVSAEDVFVVWYSKTLQNHKSILGVKGRPVLYEAKYNDNEDELYLDEYTKVHNQKFELFLNKEED